MGSAGLPDNQLEWQGILFAADLFLVHQVDRGDRQEFPVFIGMGADGSERGAGIGCAGNIIVACHGEISGDRKPRFANCQHSPPGDRVISGEKRGGTSARGQDLLHRAVTALKGEVPLGEERLVERELPFQERGDSLRGAGIRPGSPAKRGRYGRLAGARARSNGR